MASLHIPGARVRSGPGQASAEPERAALPPTAGPMYVISGRPGYRYSTLDEACATAADLVRRLRLSKRVEVREAGTDTMVAMAATDPYGNAYVIRLKEVA